MMTSSESCSVTPSHGNPYAELGVVDCVTSSRLPIKLPLEWCELLAPASHGSIVLTSCCSVLQEYLFSLGIIHCNLPVVIFWLVIATMRH